MSVNWNQLLHSRGYHIAEKPSRGQIFAEGAIFKDFAVKLSQMPWEMAVPELLRPQYLLTPPLTACAQWLKPAEKLVKDQLIEEIACESHMIKAVVYGYQNSPVSIIRLTSAFNRWFYGRRWDCRRQRAMWIRKLGSVWSRCNYRVVAEEHNYRPFRLGNKMLNTLWRNCTPWQWMRSTKSAGGSDWSHQVSVVATTTRWLQCGQTLPLSAKGVACETMNWREVIDWAAANHDGHGPS